MNRTAATTFATALVCLTLAACTGPGQTTAGGAQSTPTPVVTPIPTPTPTPTWPALTGEAASRILGEHADFTGERSKDSAAGRAVEFTGNPTPGSGVPVRRVWLTEETYALDGRTGTATSWVRTYAGNGGGKMALDDRLGPQSYAVWMTQQGNPTTMVLWGDDQHSYSLKVTGVDPEAVRDRLIDEAVAIRDAEPAR